MNILLDTQILIWSFDINSPLSDQHKKLLEDTSNKIFVSQISLMELAIKKNINKLPGFVPDLKKVVDQLVKIGFEILKLSDAQIFAYQNLPLFQDHKDPFDRFLIAIAKEESFLILTTDGKFQMYSSLIQII